MCVSAYHGKQALEKIMTNAQENQFRQIDYELILMDCNMPFMDGYEATVKIKEYLTQNKIRHPYIAAVTGHTEQSYIQKCLDSGMNCTFAKPVDIQELKIVCD